VEVETHGQLAVIRLTASPGGNRVIITLIFGCRYLFLDEAISFIFG